VVNSSGRRVIIPEVERVRVLEAFGDLAFRARNVISLRVIVVENNKLLAVSQLIQDATFSWLYSNGEAARQAEAARRARQPRITISAGPALHALPLYARETVTIRGKRAL
jgi:hypothetical protein